MHQVKSRNLAYTILFGVKSYSNTDTQGIFYMGILSSVTFGIKSYWTGKRNQIPPFLTPVFSAFRHQVLIGPNSKYDKVRKEDAS